MKRKLLPAWLLLHIFIGAQATAQELDSSLADAAEELADLLQTYYLFPDVGEQYAAWLRSRVERGDFDASASDDEFAATLTDGLQDVSADAHLRISLANGGETVRRQPQRPPTDVIQNASWLADGKAYVAITGLPESEEAQAQMAQFLDEYEGADTLVLDLRFCPGGSLSVMDVLFSRLYAEPTHLLTMDMRRGASEVLEGSFMDIPTLEQQDAPPRILRWHHVARPVARAWVCP